MMPCITGPLWGESIIAFHNTNHKVCSIAVTSGTVLTIFPFANDWNKFYLAEIFWMTFAQLDNEIITFQIGHVAQWGKLCCFDNIYP